MFTKFYGHINVPYFKVVLWFKLRLL